MNTSVTCISVAAEINIPVSSSKPVMLAVPFLLFSQKRRFELKLVGNVSGFRSVKKPYRHTASWSSAENASRIAPFTFWSH